MMFKAFKKDCVFFYSKYKNKNIHRTHFDNNCFISYVSVNVTLQLPIIIVPFLPLYVMIYACFGLYDSMNAPIKLTKIKLQLKNSKTKIKLNINFSFLEVLIIFMLL